MVGFSATYVGLLQFKPSGRGEGHNGGEWPNGGTCLLQPTSPSVICDNAMGVVHLTLEDVTLTASVRWTRATAVRSGPDPNGQGMARLPGMDHGRMGGQTP